MLQICCSYIIFLEVAHELSDFCKMARRLREVGPHSSETNKQAS